MQKQPKYFNFEVFIALNHTYATFCPTISANKKREQLQQREKELVLALKNQVPDDKLERFAEKYRQAQLSLLKAQLHAMQEMDFQGKKATLKQAKIEQEILIIQTSQSPN